jgi:hypothetical protein
MIDLLLQHFRFRVEPKAPLHLPAYNNGSTLRLTPWGNVIRGGFGDTFWRIVCHATGNRHEAMGNSKIGGLSSLGACTWS